MIYYTSDLHFCHRNIIGLNNRPFANVEEMNETLITNWNNRVRKGDLVYVLGDIGYPKNNADTQATIELIKKLNGRKVLVVGNHDRKLIKDKEFIKCFENIQVYLEVNDNRRKVVLFHYPIEEWNGFYRDAIHLYGHVHNNKVGLRTIKNRYNVGVDVNDYMPVTLDEILERKPL